jgi:hypothetical protein
MSAENPLQPALFLHIQKTGGTSILEAVRRFYGASLVSHGGCWGYRPESLQNVGFISGHFGFDYARGLLPGRFSFTLLRDPVARVLSMYFFCRGRDPQEFVIYERASSLALEEFLLAGFTDPWVKKNIWNNQVWQLAHGYAHLDGRTISDFDEEELLAMAKRHLHQLSYVGFTESIEQDLPEILAGLGIPSPGEVPKANITPVKPASSAIPKSIYELVQSLTRLDSQLYDYAKAVQPTGRGFL